MSTSRRSSASNGQPDRASNIQSIDIAGGTGCALAASRGLCQKRHNFAPQPQAGTSRHGQSRFTRSRPYPHSRTGARHRARCRRGCAVAWTRRREGCGPGGGRRHALGTQPPADPGHGGDRRGRARRGTDALHRRGSGNGRGAGRRHRARSARGHHDLRQEPAQLARRHRDRGEGQPALRAGRLHGQDRGRPGLSGRHRRYRRIGPGKHREPRQGQGRAGRRDHGLHSRQAAPCAPDRGGARHGRGDPADR